MPSKFCCTLCFAGCTLKVSSVRYAAHVNNTAGTSQLTSWPLPANSTSSNNFGRIGKPLSDFNLITNKKIVACTAITLVLRVWSAVILATRITREKSLKQRKLYEYLKYEMLLRIYFTVPWLKYTEIRSFLANHNKEKLGNEWYARKSYPSDLLLVWSYVPAVHKTPEFEQNWFMDYLKCKLR